MAVEMKQVAQQEAERARFLVEKVIFFLFSYFLFIYFEIFYFILFFQKFVFLFEIGQIL